MTPIRFGSFELDVQSGQLRRNGKKIKLQEQPFQVLNLLLERPGEVLTREELTKRLWPDETYVDFERGLNKAVTRLRDALGDSAENPRYIETLPRRGYRLIVSVTRDVIAAPLPSETLPVVAIGRNKGFLRHRFWFIGISAIAVTLIAAVWFRDPKPPRVLRFTQLTHDGQQKWPSRLESDGSRIYFNEMLSDQRTLIFQVPVRGGEAVPLAIPLQRPTILDLSRDGTELLVGNMDDPGHLSLWVQPATGGSARRVGTITAADARFAADGTSIIYTDINEHDVYSVSRDGSSPRKLFTISGLPNSFQFSPDGSLLRFTSFDPVLDKMTIMEASPDGTGTREILQGAWGKWTTDARYFIFQTRRDGRLEVLALPEQKRLGFRKRVEKPFHLTAGPLDFLQPLPSRDGKQIFAIGKSDQAELIRYDRHADKFVPYLSGISAEGLDFSPDRQWVTFTSYPDGALWRCRMDGTERLQLTFPPLRVLLPRWSPDGQQIAFSARPDTDSPWGAYLISQNGGSPERVLPNNAVDLDWFPDGKSVVFGTSDASAGTPISILHLRNKSVATLPGSSGLFSPRVSPDGQHIVAMTFARPFRLMLFDAIRGDVAFYQGNLKSAKAAYEQAARVATKGKQEDDALFSKMNLARVAVAEGRSKPAIGDLRVVVEQAENRHLKYYYTRSSVDLAQALINTKEYGSAREQLESTLTQSEQMGLQLETSRIEYLLGEVARLSGQSSGAMVYYAKAHAILSQIRAEPGAEHIADRFDLREMYNNAGRSASATE
jgi:DNA-binding winged helix-turn-helix (wHTH) protein/Tol biopolymer transport system component